MATSTAQQDELLCTVQAVWFCFIVEVFKEGARYETKTAACFHVVLMNVVAQYVFHCAPRAHSMLCNLLSCKLVPVKHQCLVILAMKAWSAKQQMCAVFEYEAITYPPVRHCCFLAGVCGVAFVMQQTYFYSLLLCVMVNVCSANFFIWSRRTGSLLMGTWGVLDLWNSRVQANNMVKFAVLLVVRLTMFNHILHRMLFFS